MVKKLVVFGYGARGQIYALFAKKYPEKFQLVAVIENNQERIELAQRTHDDISVFMDYRDFLAASIKADVVAIATQDGQHKEHALAMMKAGYDLLLEKPIANNRDDCLEIYKASKQYNRKVVVCHVLRYSPFYSKIKGIIESGKIGEVFSISASENVGYYHYVHSYVRGPWRAQKESSPMILAKCCHDMDILRWLMDVDCLSVNSYGDLSYFKEDNAPNGSAEYCSSCQVENCLYNAQKLYLSKESRPFSGYFLNKEFTDENILSALKGTRYEKCAYKSDNDVVDHQVTIMQFAGGKTATLSMSAFSKEVYRDIKIHAALAELVGKFEDNYIEIRYFDGKIEKISIDTTEANVGGHNGSDYFMMNNLYNVLNGQDGADTTLIDVSVESHLMCFSAEDSRLNDGATVFIKK